MIKPIRNSEVTTTTKHLEQSFRISQSTIAIYQQN